MDIYDQFCHTCHKAGMVPLPVEEWKDIFAEYWLEIYEIKRNGEVDADKES